MLLSMTGFGKAVVEFRNKKIIAEIKSVNSKQMDISTRITGLYREKEIEIRSLIAQTLERGKVDFSLYTDTLESETAGTINASVLAAYQNQIKTIAQEQGIPCPTDWFSVLLRLPEVMHSQPQEVDEEEWKAVGLAVNQALAALVAFRTQEGASLERFFASKIDAISALLQEVQQYERPRIDKIKARLEENLRNLDDKITYDANRLEQEIIFYIEKLDITEEKQRLGNHLKYFRETMQDGHGQGKKLGFIAQEMGREINTLGSKANQSDMQIVVVKMKDELEQIKEQVLNVM